MFVLKKRNNYFAIELSLREISFVVHLYAHLHALMTRKLCAVGMRNAILRNHLKGIFLGAYFTFWPIEEALIRE